MACEMGVIVYKRKDAPFTSTERIMKCLLLPSVDDTQTALAGEDIHISESTAIKLRATARLGLTEHEFIVQKHKPTAGCWDRFKRILTRLFTPYEKRT